MNNHKKILSVVLALILALSVIPVSLSASAAESDTAPVGDYQGEPERGLVDPDYPDYEYLPTDDGVKVVYYNGEGGDITIPSFLDGQPVTGIGTQCFQGVFLAGVTSIVFPDTVKVIDDNALYYMEKLKSVTFSNSLVHIGKWAFYGCLSLKKIVLPDSVVTIDDGAFCECTALEEVKFSSSEGEI